METLKRPWVSNLFLLLFGIYSLLVLYSNYVQGIFGYHDLTLISEFLSSTAHGRGIFWIPQEGFTHLKIHFTPTLFLLTPFFSLFDTQFLFLFLTWLGWMGGLWATCQVLKKLLPDFPIVFLAITVTGNTFLKSILIAAHFELLFFSFATLFIYSLLYFPKNKTLQIAFFSLALGVRQDSGFFLFFLTLSTCLSRYSNWEVSKRFRYILSAIALIYFLFSTIVVMRLLGGDPHESVQRFWYTLGNTWGEVFTYLILHPTETVRRIWQSAFIPLQRGLGFLSWLDFPAVLINQLPGALFYVADGMSKAQLLFYNSSFLLPGLFFTFGVGLAKIHSHFKRYARYVVFFSMAFFLIHNVRHWRNINGGSIPFEVIGLHSEKYDEFKMLTQECSNAKSIASTFHAITWAPNSKIRYLMNHNEEADLLILDPTQKTFRDPFDQPPNLKEKRLLKKGVFFESWIKKDLICS